MNIEWVEIIDGVKAVHTGKFLYYYDADTFGGKIKLRRRNKELIHFFDAETGLRFYTNCSSTEKANEVIEKMAAEGHRMIIGPKAPWSSHDGRSLIRSRSETEVGVYFAD